MAVGYAPKLPLDRHVEDGYGLLKNIRSLTQQNLKMLLLTAPGERMMDPNYGVGLRRYLFEQDTPDLKANLQKAINNQVRRYMSYIEIRGIIITTSSDIVDIPENSMQLRISYAIPSTKEIAFLDLSVASSNIS